MTNDKTHETIAKHQQPMRHSKQQHKNYTRITKRDIQIEKTSQQKEITNKRLDATKPATTKGEQPNGSNRTLQQATTPRKVLASVKYLRYNAKKALNK
ncbi:21076_t:CDS:2, partial [Gigaspora rosea]